MKTMRSFWRSATPLKTNMTLENKKPLEDVSSIFSNGGFSSDRHVSFHLCNTGVLLLMAEIPFPTTWDGAETL